MDPHAWERHAEGIVDDLTALFRDRNRVERLIYALAQAAPQGRRAAWDTYAVPAFAQVQARRPGSATAATLLASRLSIIMFTGEAASAPGRLRGLLGAQNG